MYGKLTMITDDLCVVWGNDFWLYLFPVRKILSF